VRDKIFEYIEEKSLGRYGGSKVRLRKFVDQVRFDLRERQRSISVGDTLPPPD
jgi:hypothetical protein